MAGKSPSKLGEDIRRVVAARADVGLYSSESEKSYAVLFKTKNGRPFAVERTTQSSIRFWIGQNEEVARQIAVFGIKTGKNVHSGKSEAPGWNSNIQGIKEFKEAPFLYWASAESAEDARKIVDVLTSA